MKLSELETPCLILDRTRLDRNAAAMTERMRSLGVDLRPHMKTAKSFDVAKVAIEGNRGGITVSTLKEAEYFASYGLNDIVYAVSIVPDKLPRLAALIEQGCNVAVITDQPAIARAMGERAAELGICFEIAPFAQPKVSGYMARTHILLEAGVWTRRVAKLHVDIQSSARNPEVY